MKKLYCDLSIPAGLGISPGMERLANGASIPRF